MIVAAVGHVDHGKTALVKALTGVDTDRLPEEKARGMSIELGYAYRQTDGGDIIGFVDVPGHERFVRTMVAGVGGIHHALVVIAADDGPMPQTVEHLTILDLLGIASATVALTKIDRVEPGRVAEVRTDIHALLAGTALSEAPIYPVCAPRGDGIAALWSRLAQLSPLASFRDDRGHFRLAVDRCFSLEGVGCVVTGTVLAGSVAVGDKVVVSPAGVHARVRGLRAMGRDAAIGKAGERCALNLSGTDVRSERISRGDWIVASDRCSPTDRVDAELRVRPQAGYLRTGSRVHVHVGTKKTTGRLTLLCDSRLEGGQAGLARITLEEQIQAVWGDRVVIRDWAARRTVAGGCVLDPSPAARIGGRTERLAVLRALRNTDASDALRALVEVQPDGVDIVRFLGNRNLTQTTGDDVLRAAKVVVKRKGDELLAFSLARWADMRSQIIEAIERWHRDNPDSRGPTDAELQRGFEPYRDALGVRIQALLQDNELVRAGAHLHRPGHSPSLATSDLTLWRRIESLFSEGVRPLSVARISAELGITPSEIERVLRHASQRDLVIQLPDQRFFASKAAAVLASAARELGQRHRDGLFSVAEFRDSTGIGRKLSISVLEYFDRRGLTQRAGERRRIVASGSELQR